MLMQLLGTAEVRAYNVDVDPGTRECFVLTVEEGTPCSGNYELLGKTRPGPLEISVRGPPPSRETLYMARDNVEGTFSFEAETSGDYVLCVSNGGETNADNVRRLVGFNFRSGFASDAAAGGDNEGANTLVGVVNELTEGLYTMRDHQSYMMQREEEHRQTIEGTTSNVFWWTVAEAVMLVGLALWQIGYLHKFFETKRRL